jgi:DNA-binding response OmpR family regulator
MLSEGLWLASRYRKGAPIPLAMRPSDRIDVAQRSILVIEDDPVMGMALKDELELEGYRVVAVTDNGEEAVALADQFKPDLVTVDVRLEGPVDGIEAVSSIRRRIQTKIVFVTAHVDLETRRRMNDVGFQGLIPKPYTSEQLRSTIKGVFSDPD